MSKEIAKSPEILAKEATIKTLQTKLKRKKTALKSLKTRLKNTKKDITEIQRAGSGQVMNRMAQMDKLRLEIMELIQQMNKLKGLSRADKAALKDMEREFGSEDMFGEDFKAYKAQMEERGEDFEANFDENERARMRDVFEAFAVKPDKEEQKDIRKIFISLSQKFHPDKATTKADEAEYHEMMQQINEAYQAGDIQTLLELEQLFLIENLDLSKVQSWSVDVLEQEIARLKRDLQFIESQINRNSAELKSLRASDLGQMLTSMKKAEKEGVGMNAALAQLDESVDRLTKLRDAFSECIQLGNISPLNEMMMEESVGQPSQAEMMSMLEDMMNGKMDPNDLANMFGDSDDDDDDDFWGFGDEDEAIEHAKFKEGTSVKIAKRVYDPESGIDLSGFIGRIEGVFLGDDLEVMYEIELDSLSVNKLPLIYVKEMVHEEEDFQNFEVAETDLKKCQARDSKEDTFGAYRILLHQYLWYYLDKATQKRLQTILLQHPELMDYENWEIFLKKQFKFPLNVQSRGLIDFRKGEKLKMTRLAGLNEQVGLIADVKYRNRPGNYPLFDLVSVGKDKKLKQLFDDYLAWAEEMHDL